MLTFLLGFACQAAGGQVRLAQPVRETIATFLLLAIRLEGGEALVQADTAQLGVAIERHCPRRTGELLVDLRDRARRPQVKSC